MGIQLKGGDSIKRLGIQKVGIFNQRWGFLAKGGDFWPKVGILDQRWGFLTKGGDF